MAVDKTELETITVKFAGDSGDGIQLTGDQFGNTTAIAGNDFATFPDFPSEIRAPLGTTYGVSSYQIQFASKDIYTPGDRPDDKDEIPTGQSTDPNATHPEESDSK